MAAALNWSLAMSEISGHWSAMFRALVVSVSRSACPVLVLGSSIRFPGLAGGYSPAEWPRRAANEDQDTAPRGVK